MSSPAASPSSPSSLPDLALPKSKIPVAALKIIINEIREKVWEFEDGHRYGNEAIREMIRVSGELGEVVRGLLSTELDLPLFGGYDEFVGLSGKWKNVKHLHLIEHAERDTWTEDPIGDLLAHFPNLDTLWVTPQHGRSVPLPLVPHLQKLRMDWANTENFQIVLATPELETVHLVLPLSAMGYCGIEVQGPNAGSLKNIKLVLWLDDPEGDSYWLSSQQPVDFLPGLIGATPLAEDVHIAIMQFDHATPLNLDLLFKQLSLWPSLINFSLELHTSVESTSQMSKIAHAVKSRLVLSEKTAGKTIRGACKKLETFVMEVFVTIEEEGKDVVQELVWEFDGMTVVEEE